MSFLGEMRGTYVNPELSGGEALDPVHIVAQPYRPEDRTGVRRDLLISGVRDGMPGYTRQDLMSSEDAEALALKIEANHAHNSPQAQNRRQVIAFVGGEKAGVAVYDSSVPWGAPESERPSGKLARMTACVVASCTSSVEQFSLDQMETIGAALGYGATRDMQDRGLERVRYDFAGLGIDAEENERRFGITVLSEMITWQTNHPWLKRVYRG